MDLQVKPALIPDILQKFVRDVSARRNLYSDDFELQGQGTWLIDVTSTDTHLQDLCCNVCVSVGLSVTQGAG